MVVMINFLLGLDFGSGAGFQSSLGAWLGTLTVGKEPISCCSKHSSAAGLVMTDPLSSAKSPVTEDGRDTVAAKCDWGISKAFLLAESTGRKFDFGDGFLCTKL